MSASTEDLLAAHAAAHAALEDAVFDVLAALVRTDMDGAHRRWRSFTRALEAHLAFEEGRVLPAYAPVAPPAGPGRLDHVEGDHTILRRQLEAVAAALERMTTAGALRAILEELPHLYRLLGVLEHHRAREQLHVYPAVAAAWSGEERRDVVAGLTGLVDPAATA